MPNEPRLRGSGKRRNSLYPLGEIPHNTVVEIGKHIVHRVAVGMADITGDDFGAIFAKAISGTHRGKPLGIADVMWNDCAWSVKTVKVPKPFEASNIRVISGRNSPSYSSEITDPFANIQATGRVILGIWNGRVDQAAKEHDDLRIMIMIRNMRRLEFVLMEQEATRFVPSDYEWRANKQNNLLGFDKHSGQQRFTWQHSGSQFTIHHHVPASAYCFRITNRPAMLAEAHVLRLVGFEDSWIVAVPKVEEGKIIPLTGV